MTKNPTRFQKGTSGNPKGRPRGCTPRADFRKQVADALPSIVAGLVTAAQAGDVQAIRIILDRCIPTLKPTSDTIAITVPAGADLVQRGEAIIAAAVSGTLPVEQAKALMDALNCQRAMIEQSEIIIRLETVERWLRQHKNAP